MHWNSSRVFCPIGDVPEVPATGSAHSLLRKHLATRFQIGEEGSTEFIGRQVSKPPGEIGVRVDHWARKYRLCGNAALMAKREIYFPK